MLSIGREKKAITVKKNKLMAILIEKNSQSIKHLAPDI